MDTLTNVKIIRVTITELVYARRDGAERRAAIGSPAVYAALRSRVGGWAWLRIEAGVVREAP